MAEFAPVIIAEIYQTKPSRFRRRPQTWRWRAFSEGNRRVLASGEAYTNLSDAQATVALLFGVHSTVYQWQAEHGSVLLRMAYPQETPDA